MAVTRRRRTGVRRATLILASAGALSVASMALGPVPSTGRSPDPTGAPTPAPSAPAAPLVQPIAVRPRAPDGPSATLVTRQALQARLEQLRERYGIPGISVAILFPDGSSWVGVSGMADVAADKPVTPTTAFAIASVSKTFTSALIMALVEDGRLELDATVRTYLPSLKISPKITIRQLLDQTSGLRDYFFHPSIDKLLLSHPERRWDASQALRYVGKAYFKPGQGFHYSNTNYLILGLLAEKAGSAPLAEQLRTRFLQPLGLTHTWYQPGEPALDRAAHGYRFESGARDATPIDLSDGTTMVPFSSVVTAAGGAGGLASSPSDLARWARALYAGGVLDENTVQAIMDDVFLTERFEPSVPYGLGVQSIVIDEHRTLGHSGRLLGFRSAVRWLPDDNVAIAVLTNQSRTDPGLFVRALLKIALDGAPACRCADRR